MPNQNKIIVSFDSVKKSFAKKIVLDDLSFDIKEHDLIALIGNNGCGKTTTINVLCNLIPHEEGELYVFGKKITSNYVSYKNRFGIVLSHPYFIEVFNPVEYLKFVCRFQHVPKNQIKDRINDIISLLDLQNDLSKPIKKLSSGNQMKVSLAAALIHNPQILVLDEPFVNLDISTTEKIITLLKSLKRKKTLLITSHNLNLVVDLCDRFLVMDQGKIVLEVNKSDYPSVELLKTAITEQLVGTEKLRSLDWLR